MANLSAASEKSFFTEADHADDYATYRPKPPRKLIEAIVAKVGVS